MQGNQDIDINDLFKKIEDKLFRFCRICEKIANLC